VRGALLTVAVVLACLASGCSDDKPVVTAASDANAEQNLRRDCANPTWREQNLGLWYSLCRQPLHW
jgi:hypothetical protein